jgi:hypothetical protein
MTPLDKALYRTRNSFRQACQEAGIDYNDELNTSLGECAHCNIWLKPKELIPDLDNNPICKTCFTYEGA